MTTQHKKRCTMVLVLFIAVMMLAAACQPRGTAETVQQPAEAEAQEETTAAEETSSAEEPAASEETTPAEAETAEEDQPAPMPVSGLASGWYPYTNRNMVRDLLVYQGNVYAATLGGMTVSNLVSGDFTAYTPLDGMKHVSAFSITVCDIPETRIIVGTSIGLSIFDPAYGSWEARELTPEDSKVDGNRISRLVCDQANNRLLIGYAGLGVLDLGTGDFQRYTTDNGLLWNEVTDILVQGKDIWVANGVNGVARIANGTVTTYTADNGMPDKYAYSLAASADGTLWVGAAGGLLSFKGGQWQQFGGTTEAKITDLHELEATSDGKVWAASAPLGGGRLCLFDPQSAACAAVITDSMSQPILALALDENGNPVYGTNKGIYWVEGEMVSAYIAADELASNFADTFAQAPDGMLWVGTDAGIQVLDPADPSQLWTTYARSTTEGLGGSWGTDLAISPDGVVWAAITNGTASRFEGGTWRTFEELSSYDAVTLDAEGRAWFGDDYKGIVVLNADGTTAMTFTTAEGLPSDSVYALLTDASGTIWIGTANGLAKYADGSLSTVFGSDDTRLPNRYIRSLALAPDGSLIIGTFTGVSRYADGGEPQTVIDFLKDGYTNARLTCVAAAPGGRLWVGTDSGLLYSDDLSTWTMLTTKDGLMTNYINDLLVDSFGALWVGGGSNFGGGGILHIVP